MKRMINNLQGDISWFGYTLSMRCYNTDVKPKILQRICFFVLTWICVLAAHASRSEGVNTNFNHICVDGICYNIIDTEKSELEVINPSQYDGYGNPVDYEGLIVVPETVSFDGQIYRVVRIGTSAFKHTYVTKVVLPPSITSMGNFVFWECRYLISVTLPPNLEVISPSTFYGCTKLESVNLPKTVKTIGPYAFYACNLSTPLEIPEGVETIGTQAYMCTNIPEVKLPASLKTIGNECFARCPYLTKVVIPSVNRWLRVKVGKNLFNTTFYDLYEANGNKVQHVTLPADLDSFPANAFVRCGSLTSATLHDRVKVVGANAFYKCWNMAKFNLPESLRTIEPGAFMECKSTTDIMMPSKLEIIGDSAFRGCQWLQRVTFSGTPTAVGGDVFRDCSHLSQMTLPNGLTTVPNGMFYGCKALTQVTMPNTVTSLGHKSFKECANLKTITLSNTLTTIGNEVFKGCAGLTNLTLPLTTLTLGDRAFQDCLNLSKLDVSSLLTSVGNSAFMGCKLLTTNFRFNKLASLGDSAFYDCTYLTGVKFNAPSTTIGACAFARCTMLSDVKLPDSLQVMSEKMFYQCASLKKITIPATVSRLKDKTLAQCAALQDIYFYPWNKMYEYVGWIESGSTRTIHTYEIVPYSWLKSYGTVNTTFPIPRPTVIYVNPETLTLKKLNTKYKLPDLLSVSTDSKIYERLYADRMSKRWYGYLSDDEDVLVVDDVAQECYTLKNGVATLVIRVSDSTGFELTRSVKVYIGNALPDGVDGVTTDEKSDRSVVKRIVNGLPVIIKGSKTYTLSGAEKR